MSVSIFYIHVDHKKEGLAFDRKLHNRLKGEISRSWYKKDYVVLTTKEISRKSISIIWYHNSIVHYYKIAHLPQN